MCSTKSTLAIEGAADGTVTVDGRVSASTSADCATSELYRCLDARADALFELGDALLCHDGPVKALVDLVLAPEHRRGYGALYDGLNAGRIEISRLRRALTGLPVPRTADGRIVLAVDVSPWLRSDAACSPERLFCHVYGRAKSASQFIPGWPYSFVAALESGRTSWVGMLDAVRLGPEDDTTAVTAAQLREVIERLVAAGHWTSGDPPVVIVTDSGYDVTRLAFVLSDLPVELVGRIRSDRVLRLPKPVRVPGTNGRPSKHGREFMLAKPETWTSSSDPRRSPSATASPSENTAPTQAGTTTQPTRRPPCAQVANCVGGVTTPPCGVPVTECRTDPSTITPAPRIKRRSFRTD